MGDKTYIYGLADPRSGIIRYVGQSTDPLRRLVEHESETGRRTEKGIWLEELSRIGVGPDLIILERCPSEIASRMENLYMANADARCFFEGVFLVNERSRA